MNLAIKLAEKLENILYKKRMELGLLLEWYEIDSFIKVIKNKDHEAHFLLDCFINDLSNDFNNDYLKAEKKFKKFLNYYGLYGKKNILNCRHQFFFSENKKVIKKPFFDKEEIQELKNKYKNIFEKIEASDEV